MYANKYFPHYAFQGVWVSFNRWGNKQTFYTEQEAKDFSEQGSVTDYKGFVITPAFKVYKDKKEVFTAPWQDCDTLEKAMKMIDNSLAAKIEHHPFEEWQVDRYENIEPENGSEESERFAAWSREQHERELFEHSNY